MKTHNWKKEIINATSGCNSTSYSFMRIVNTTLSKKNYKNSNPVIQQVCDGFVGLQVKLPKPFNKADSKELVKIGTDMGFYEVF